MLSVQSFTTFVNRFPIERATESRKIGVSATRHESVINHNSPMTSVGTASDPWPLLRNSGSVRERRALHLVVHGRSGGVVPDCFIALADAVQQRRGAPVQLEVLTSPDQPPRPEFSTWLIPLLLWPGAHARIDLPAIRQRLQSAGAVVTMLPFLGAWPLWWDAVEAVLHRLHVSDAVLVHHPLRSGVADRFLVSLASRLDLPLVPFDCWPSHRRHHPQATPLPLTLAPNRMTDALREAGGLPPLLEHPLTYQALIDLLAALP
tara:strand:+ start:5008 stop:5793 length:786 start_codon:yes stop_codon:yes gene_type:complete